MIVMQAKAIQLNPQAAPAAHGGYDPVWFDLLAKVEERHFWFRARNRIIAGVARELVAQSGPHTRILEVGCGNGNVLRVLRQLCPAGRVVGMDLFEEGLNHARRRCDCELVPGDIFKAPFAPGSFDMIGMFDVLEHLPDDLKALRALHSLLAPGGAVLLTVPACPALWSAFDEVGGHYRRYERRGLIEKFKECGFDVPFATHFMMATFPLVWAARRLGSRRCAQASPDANDAFRAAANELKVRPVSNGILFTSLAWESWWISRRLRLPFGTSLLAVARKSDPRGEWGAVSKNREHIAKAKDV
jgi:SAM-dependent methyltransferase